jgi:UDP-GlcNAc:undecaprenyl-phosphate GlcNAc-1-phosphate transferase
MVAILSSLWLDPITQSVVPLEPDLWSPVIVGGAIVFLAGVWDDIRSLPAWIKFVCQALAAGIAIWCGISIGHISIVGGGRIELGILAVPVTFLWIVGVTNAFNLVDGLDGLAAGLAIIAAGTSATIFLLRGQIDNALFLLILAGALAGFLCYNFNPATIFLGDSGSLFVGYVLAVIAIAGSQKPAFGLAVVIPLLLFGLPLADTGLSMVRRFVGSLRLIQPYRAPIKRRMGRFSAMFEPDKRHIHHRLLALGFSHRNAVLVLYTFALVLSFLALISMLAQYRNAGIILIIVAIAGYIGIHKLGYDEIALLKAGTLLRWYDRFALDRRFFLGFLDVVLIAIAYWSAFVLKYELPWPRELRVWYLETFPTVTLIQLIFFLVFGHYRGVWRSTGIGDLVQLSGTVAVSVALSYSVAVISHPPGNGVASFFFIDFLLLEIVVLGTRSAYRILHYVNQRELANKGDAVLIYGAGHRGQSVVRELLHDTTLKLRPVGFIDDEPRLRNRTIDRVPVLGAGNDLASLLEKQSVRALIVSSHKIKGNHLYEVIRICRERQISVLRSSLRMETVEVEERLTNIKLGHQLNQEG